MRPATLFVCALTSALLPSAALAVIRPSPANISGPVGGVFTPAAYHPDHDWGHGWGHDPGHHGGGFPGWGWHGGHPPGGGWDGGGWGHHPGGPSCSP